QVEEIRKRIGYEHPPLDLAMIEMGVAEVQICEIPHSPVASEIFYLDDTRRIAQVNIRAKEVTPNKVLYACHALGHYLLHPKECYACRLDFYGEMDPKEIEATYFAETLIMPPALVQRLYETLSDAYDPVYKMAKCFAVRRQLMEDRLS